MRTSITKTFVQSLIFKCFLISLACTSAYHVFFFIYSLAFPGTNIYSANVLNTIITVIGFYFSIVPIKALSLLIPNWYYLTDTTKFPFAKDIWIFLIEQSLVILYITLTLFVIYIIIMWIRRFYKRFIIKESQPWGRISILLGIFSVIYYVCILFVEIILINSLR